jgi:DNA-binding transcriptional MocR family regulator
MLSLERRKRVLELAVKYQTLIVEDDPYGDLYFDAPPPPSLLALSEQVPGSRDWLVHCGSLSKVLARPARGLADGAARAAGQGHHVQAVQRRAHQHLRPGHRRAYLAAGHMPATLARVRATYGQRAQAMGQALRQELGAAVDFVPPQGGLFVWARLTGAGGKLQDAGELARRAIEQGVAFVPGAPFYCAQPDRSTCGCRSPPWARR